jgi:Mn-dependent DtxR family transcriptional regulator
VETVELSTKERYIALKIRKKIKTKDIAKHLGVTPSLISQYENHDAKMSLENVRKYRKFIENY